MMKEKLTYILLVAVRGLLTLSEDANFIATHTHYTRELLGERENKRSRCMSLNVASGISPLNFKRSM